MQCKCVCVCAQNGAELAGLVRGALIRASADAGGQAKHGKTPKDALERNLERQLRGLQLLQKAEDDSVLPLECGAEE